MRGRGQCSEGHRAPEPKCHDPGLLAHPGHVPIQGVHPRETQTPKPCHVTQ